MLMNNDPEWALKDILKVLTVLPNDFNAICTHAKAIYQLGQFERSLMLWHKAKKIKRTSQEVRGCAEVSKICRCRMRLRASA